MRKVVDSFQGDISKKNYFEGWYYKFVNQDHSCYWVMIVGVSLGEKEPHAFVQLVSNQWDKPYYFKYPVTQFGYQTERFEVTIGENVFSDTCISFREKREDVFFDIAVQMEQSCKLAKTFYRPTIMGPASYLKGLECHHEIVCLKNRVKGYVMYQGISISVDDGQGYIEKDYGSSFPERYLWMQSHSSHDGDMFVLGQGKVPILKVPMTGLFLVLYIQGKELVFTNYYGARMTQMIHKEGKDILSIRQGKYLVKITCSLNQGNSLPSPKIGTMGKNIIEYNQCEANVEVYKNGQLFYQNHFVQVSYENHW